MSCRFPIAASLTVLIALAGSASAADPLFAFTTSTSGSGDLHSWADVSESTLLGLEAADGICRARAQAGGLASPADFVAWLSDAENDAYCRVSGFAGKKSDRCGQPDLPTGAGPWLRTDGAPFAAPIERATADNAIFSPLDLDESGKRIAGAPLQAYTATSPLGTFDTSGGGGDCAAWQSASPEIDAVLGNELGTAQAWTNSDAGSGCSSPHHLICMQKGQRAGLAGFATFGRRDAFVSSIDVDGDLGGLAGADATCRSLAANLHQPESFKALLASGVAGTNILDRFVYDGPWFRRDGLMFVRDKAGLVSGQVATPLNVTESGAYLGFSLALTGANSNGSPNSLNCGAWTSAGNAIATGGVANLIGPAWLSNADIACSGAQPGDWPVKLWCLSDSDTIFHDELESLPQL